MQPLRRWATPARLFKVRPAVGIFSLLLGSTGAGLWTYAHVEEEARDAHVALVQATCHTLPVFLLGPQGEFLQTTANVVRPGVTDAQGVCDDIQDVTPPGAKSFCTEESCVVHPDPALMPPNYRVAPVEGPIFSA